jgi:hypothetical protein
VSSLKIYNLKGKFQLKSHNFRVLGPDSEKQVEIEVLSSPQGVVNFIELIKSVYSDDSSEVMKTLRIYDLNKVRT